MKRAALALAALIAAGVALTACSGVSCTPGQVCVVTPVTAAPMPDVKDREGPRVPPAPDGLPSPTKSRKKPGPPKSTHSTRSGRNVTFKIRQVTVSPRPTLTIVHQVEERRPVRVEGYDSLGYRYEEALVAPGLLATMTVTATAGNIRAMECWIEIGGRVAAKGVNVGNECFVETVVR